MLIGARTAAWSKPTARDYVQDGLIAMWDGIENAGWGVHNANATTWVDLINSCTFNIPTTGSDVYSWENGALKRVGVGGISGTFSSLVIPTPDEVTLELGVSCEQITSLVDSSYYIAAWNSSTGAAGRLFLPNVNKVAFTADSYTYVSSGVVCPFAASSWSFVKQSEYYSTYTDRYVTDAYYNGQKKSWMRWTRYGFDGWIGLFRAIRNWNQQTTFSFYYARLYHRALTADEIAANHVIDKARFNMPI